MTDLEKATHLWKRVYDRSSYSGHWNEFNYETLPCVFPDLYKKGYRGVEFKNEPYFVSRYFQRKFKRIEEEERRNRKPRKTPHLTITQLSPMFKQAMNEIATMECGFIKELSK